MVVPAKLRIRLTLCAVMGAAAAVRALAAGPPSPTLIVPDTAQSLLQSQLAIQQSQAEARRAETQAQVQAELNANQARLEEQLALQRAKAQAQFAERTGSGASAAELAELSVLAGRPMQEPLPNGANPSGTMQLLTLTPRLGRYFGTAHGVLVTRAPTHGVLKLQDGDVILSIGGRVQASSSQAIRILTSYDPGETIELVILRDHREIHLSATLPASLSAP